MERLPLTFEVTDFTGCTLAYSDADFHPDGQVVCPPDQGNWEGFVRWDPTAGRYRLHYHADGITPIFVRVFVDPERLMAEVASSQKTVLYHQDRVLRLLGLLKRALEKPDTVIPY